MIKILLDQGLPRSAAELLSQQGWDALHVSGASAPSVVRLRIEGLKGSELAALLVRVWDRAGVALTHGAIATVTLASIRIKDLPIGQKLWQD